MRRVVAFDSETSLIRPALLAPPLVCLTWQEPGQAARIVHHSDAEPVLRQWLESDCIIVGHNVAYDLAVVCERFPHLRSLVFKAYAEDRVTDTMLRQQLLDIAGGIYRGQLNDKQVWRENKYDLESLAKRCAGMVLVKDAWRLSYGEFLDTPLADWPRRATELQAAARAKLSTTDDPKALESLRSMVNGDPSRASEYPLDDARATLAVYLSQEQHATYLEDQYRQARAAWALHLSSAWGLRTDEAGVETLRAATQAEYDDLESELIQVGLIRNDKKRTRDTKAAKARMVRVCTDESMTLRRTDGHTKGSEKCRDAEGGPLPGGDERCVEHVSLDSDACKATGDSVLEAYAEIGTCKKVLTNDVEALAKGVAYPVHTRYGMAETGRTTSSRPNIQNLRRKAGIREAFVPRPGKVLAAADYPQLELYTLAQCCVKWVGKSKLSEALNGGLDPHLAMAANIVGCSYEEAKARIDSPQIDNARQTAKVANFGFPGGLGIPKLCLFAKKTYGVDLTEGAAKLLKSQWFATWPEMRGYFGIADSFSKLFREEESRRLAQIAALETSGAMFRSLFTKRQRAGMTYCAACNNGFQALGSDCAKESLWRVAREQYDAPTSALYNTRTVAFVHDEIIIEADEATAHDAALRLADVMVEGANIYLPDVQISREKVKPLLMRRWSKKAKPVFSSDGRLVPWAL